MKIRNLRWLRSIFSKKIESEDEYSTNYHNPTFKQPTEAQLETYRIRAKQALENSNQNPPLLSNIFPGKKIVLIDSNENFRTMMKHYADSQMLSLECYHSVFHMGSVGMFGSFDVAIVENDHGELKGEDIDKLLSSLFKNTSMVVITDIKQSLKAYKKDWISPTRNYLHKDSGANSILKSALIIA